MIEFESWPPLLKLAFLIIPFVVGLLGVAIHIQISMSRDYDVALSAIRSNPYLEQMKPVWGGGNLRSRFFLLSTVSSLVTFPWLHLRMGWLDEQELKRFPVKLKKKMGIAWWLILIGSLWLLVAYFFIQ
ncbi:hypothetical protein [Pseudomonas sp. Teo4]|uniref:hypothetical protein n=1 Tax=Pseudomonas sp. Teo4 TaxID=3064528 RepID=UPI002ABA5BA0|nr:hypothetical protein [Pseudomonas sp. Teo4]MDZ3991087.1 hypothetical protein [Pseudomonas sp. Teo4]